jgi:4-coumarate--CoA ligase
VSVFGIPHPELGHEPYVVAESFRVKTEDQIRQQVVDVFGEASTPAGACTLHQLGLSQFPVNATGKIMKCVHSL